MLTLQIGGNPIAVIDAEMDRARELLDDEEFLDDLLSMTSDGEPLWDGLAALTLRAATEWEVDVAKEAAEEGDDAEEGDLLVVFIVPLDDEDDDI